MKKKVYTPSIIRGRFSNFAEGAMPIGSGMFKDLRNVRWADTGLLTVRQEIDEVGSVGSGGTPRGLWAGKFNGRWTLFASLFSAGKTSIYKSTNGGANWAECTESSGRYDDTRLDYDGTNDYPTSFAIVHSKPGKNDYLIAQNGFDYPFVYNGDFGAKHREISLPENTGGMKTRLSWGGGFIVRDSGEATPTDTGNVTLANTGASTHDNKIQLTMNAATSGDNSKAVFTTEAELHGCKMIYIVLTGTAVAIKEFVSGIKVELERSSALSNPVAWKTLYDPSTGDFQRPEQVQAKGGTTSYTVLGYYVPSDWFTTDVDSIRFTWVATKASSASQTLDLLAIVASNSNGQVYAVRGGCEHTVSYFNSGSRAESPPIVLPVETQLMTEVAATFEADLRLPNHPSLYYAANIYYKRPTYTESNRGVNILNVYRREHGEETAYYTLGAILSHYDVDDSAWIFTDPDGTVANVKAPVRAATTANITLSGAQTIDGVAVVAGDRVLVKDQSTKAENGIYVAAAGAWSRSADADADSEVTFGISCYVEEGTANGTKQFELVTTEEPIVVGTTELVFRDMAGALTSFFEAKEKHLRDYSRPAPSDFVLPIPVSRCMLVANGRLICGARGGEKADSPRIDAFPKVMASSFEEPFRFSEVSDPEDPFTSAMSLLPDGESCLALKAVSGGGGSTVYAVTDSSVHQVATHSAGTSLFLTRVLGIGTCSAASVVEKKGRIYFVDTDGRVQEVFGGSARVISIPVDDVFQAVPSARRGSIAAAWWRDRVYFAITPSGSLNTRMIIYSERAEAWESLDTLGLSKDSAYLIAAPTNEVGTYDSPSGNHLYFVSSGAAPNVCRYEVAQGDENATSPIGITMKTGTDIAEDGGLHVKSVSMLATGNNGTMTVNLDYKRGTDASGSVAMSDVDAYTWKTVRPTQEASSAPHVSITVSGAFGPGTAIEEIAAEILPVNRSPEAE